MINNFFQIVKIKNMLVFITSIIILCILTSVIVSYFVTKSLTNIRFVPESRVDNSDYGYLEISGKRYYQLYTTTQDDIGNGLHIHRIDLRGEK